ncbi:hypothetical protein BRC87_00470 [Halobacteriales archaeon QS_4_66_20]|nr:MAG: hypothetical protein BRC87_00470 [Halobacteriales archaeon QS_4_66_20]
MIFPFQPSDFNSNWYSTLASQITIYDKPELTANTADHSQITWLDCYRMYDIFNQIYDEYDQIGSNLNSVVNDTVNGLEEGTIELSQVISGDTLLDEYDPNDQRGQLHREAMAVGMEMPGEPGFQAKVSHPDLSADSLWVDLFLRLADGVDLTVSGPMTIPAADYDHALIGYAGQASGEYQYRTLDSGSGDLEILQLETTDQEVREVDKTVGEGGTVVLAPTEDENTPMPLAEPDPKYDSWGISVYAADDSSWGGTVGDAYTMDQDGTEVWAVDTSLSQGLAVERIHYNPDSTFKNTSVWTPDGSGYSVTDAETTIEFRRALNEAIDQAFSDAFGGGGFFDGGLPSLPGLGFIESVIVVILAIFGLNAASG